MCLQPIIEATLTSWPPRLGVVGWRFGYLMSLSGVSFVPLLALLLAFALSAQLGDRRITLLVGAIGVVAGLCWLIATGTFVLDALQMRSQARTDSVTRFNVGTSWSAAKLAVASLAGLLLGFSAMRAAIAMRRDERNATSKSAPLIIGRKPDSRHMDADHSATAARSD
jgi:hypothetical protein